MRFSLQQMVQRTLAEAAEREKLSAAEEPAKKEPEKEKKRETKEAKEPEKGSTKTSSAYAEKLASAVEYLNSMLFPKLASEQGLLPNNLRHPIHGKQNYDLGGSRRIPLRPGKDAKSPGQTNPDTALETNMDIPPGGDESWKDKDILKQSSVQRVKAILEKMAGEDVARAVISAAHRSEPPAATTSEEEVPPLPQPAAKEKALIESVRAAIALKKQQAKAEPKRQMGEVLDEPAQKKSTDPVLHNNLAATGQAGVKISSADAKAARELLKKIKEEDSARSEKLKELLKAKQEERKAADTEKEGALLGGGY